MLPVQGGLVSTLAMCQPTEEKSSLVFKLSQQDEDLLKGLKEDFYPFPKSKFLCNDKTGKRSTAPPLRFTPFVMRRMHPENGPGQKAISHGRDALFLQIAVGGWPAPAAGE